MKPYKWRTSNAGYRYVDADTGSDLFGDGTQANPFRSLRRAFDYTPTKPARIVCRGYFSEDMADGNHNCIMSGDYMGAATFDGQNTFILYGFSLINMIVRNCPAGTSTTVVAAGSGLYAGAGRANNASFVGNAHYVNGVAGSPVIVDRSALYWGGIGGTTAVMQIVYSRLIHNPTYLLGFAFQGNSRISNCTFYHARIVDRRKRFTTTGGTFFASLFGDFDMFADDAGVVLEKCVILADCKWYYNGSEIVLSGATPALRQQSLINEMDSLAIPEANRMVFDDCLFSLQTSNDVFNNPDKMDFTIKVDSDAIITQNEYRGAMQPALSVPILDDSTGVVGSWDETTVSGCVAIDNNNICVDDTSPSLTGEVLSKVVRIDVSKVEINGIFSDFSSLFTATKSTLWTNNNTGVSYTEGQTLPIGRYIVKGGCVYNDNNLGDGSIAVVTSSGTTFIETQLGTTFVSIEDANISNAVYVRFTPTYYARIESTDGLQSGGTYYNYANENIIYRGRTIVPRESFVAVNAVDTFTSSAGYKIGVMFDDTRVPYQDWIPAQLYGEYFAWYQAGVLQRDTDNIPISSGNYLSFFTSANGGYSNLLTKRFGVNAFFQFKVMVNRYD